jgi:hypothetical protein
MITKITLNGRQCLELNEGVYCLPGKGGMALNFSQLTLFVISILAIVGVLSGAVFGLVALGAAAIMCASQIQRHNHNWPATVINTIITTALPIIVGCLAITGIVSSVTAGWIVLGTALSLLGCNSLYKSCASIDRYTAPHIRIDRA